MIHFRSSEGDNPAWPGLLDIFAFTFALLALGYAALQKPDDVGRCLRARTAEIASAVASRLDSTCGVEVALNQDSTEIVIAGVSASPITFESGKYEFAEPTEWMEYDPMLPRHRLEAIARAIGPVADIEGVEIVIAGRADAVPMPESDIPPKDNPQLSALRSSTVSQLVLETAPRLAGRLIVTGLGEQGVIIPGADWNDPRYAENRRISLTIRLRVTPSFLEQCRGL